MYQDFNCTAYQSKNMGYVYDPQMYIRGSDANLYHLKW